MWVGVSIVDSIYGISRLPYHRIVFLWLKEFLNELFHVALFVLDPRVLFYIFPKVFSHYHGYLLLEYLLHGWWLHLNIHKDPMIAVFSQMEKLKLRVAK